MSLFQCENCGCRENTALSAQGFSMMDHLFDWSYNPDLKGRLLCSACGPTHYNDGNQTKYGKWHNQFPRTFLPKGMFFTNSVGNLEHKETGSDRIMQYAIEAPSA